MQIISSIFKDYDIRGEYPNEVNEKTYEYIARELVIKYQPGTIAVGRDVRLSSESLQKALINGFILSGVNVIDLGIISTDMHFFAAGKYNYDIVIVVTGSHAEGKNGMKLSLKNAIAVSGESGLYQIRDALLKRENYVNSKNLGVVSQRDITREWVSHCLSLIDTKTIKKYCIAIDTGNGVGGEILKMVEEKLPGKFTNMYFDPNGNFPNHFPNPMIEKNIIDLKSTVTKKHLDLGVAFDADADRAFFVDENGKSHSGTILTAIIAKHFLLKSPGETILYNAVCGRVVPETIKKYGGIPVRVRVGYSIIRPKMRELNAIFCGEHSGHFYYRDNYYADSGLTTMLILLEIMSSQNKKLSELAAEFDIYAQSGEINYIVNNKSAILKIVEKRYIEQSVSTDYLDGLSVWFNDYWFNLRPSNTELLLRLNVEANDDNLLMKKLKEIEDLLLSQGCELKSE